MKKFSYLYKVKETNQTTQLIFKQFKQIVYGKVLELV